MCEPPNLSYAELVVINQEQFRALARIEVLIVHDGFVIDFVELLVIGYCLHSNISVAGLIMDTQGLNAADGGYPIIVFIKARALAVSRGLLEDSARVLGFG